MVKMINRIRENVPCLRRQTSTVHDKNGTGNYSSDGPVGDRRQSTCKTLLKQNALTLATFGAVIAGLILGFALRSSTEWTKRKVMYLNYPGELFLRMLKCLILPLIMSSLVTALGNLDLKLSGRIGLRAVTYYLSTTVLAVILGIILVTSIHPGKGNPDEIHKKGEGRNLTTVDTLLDLVRNLFPPNIVHAAFNQYQTVLKYPGEKIVNVTDANGTVNATTSMVPDKHEWEVESMYGGGTNILGIVMFSIVLGIAIAKLEERGRPLLHVFNSMSEAIMLMTRWVIWLTPVGVTFLIASKVVGTKSFDVMIGQLGLYVVTVLTGLFLHGFIVLPLLYVVVVRTWPFRFIMNMFQAMTTAFGTASSSATLPVTISCLEDKNNIDPRVSRFCLPIGATINMDGTALYEAVAALFIAQVRSVPLSATKIIAVSITATAASIGAAGIPQAGLVTMVMVLNVVGLPSDDVAFIIAVDWFLDRFRTMINVLGDSIGAGIVAHLSKKEIADVEAQQNKPHCIDDEASKFEQTTM